MRLVQAPQFVDRVVHHALCRVIGPLLEASLIDDTYACRKGKGTHAAVARVQHFLRKYSSDAYVLQIDVSKFFPSVNRQILMGLLSERFRERALILILDRVVYYDNANRGLPIGALTSQNFANYYLSPLDHFVKEILGVKAYVRYMDDAVMIFNDKVRAVEAKKEIQWFLEAHLDLRMNPKSCIYKAKQGVDFAGYRIWAGYIRPRKRNLKAARIRFKRLSAQYAVGEIGLEAITPRVMSFLGYMDKCDGRESAKSVLSHLILRRKP